MEAGTSAPLGQGDAGYGGASVAGAALATVFFPFIALIVALLLLGNQSDPRKRSQLRTWAWISGAWLALGVVLAVLLATVTFAVGSAGSIQVSSPQVVRSGSPAQRSGPCSGGPMPGSPAKQIPGTHKFVQPCAFGGTATITLPSP